MNNAEYTWKSAMHTLASFYDVLENLGLLQLYKN